MDLPGRHAIHLTKGRDVTSTPTAFFHKTYDETMVLLVEMRDYVARRENGGMGSEAASGRLDPVDRMQVCCESMRVTARLTHVMAWLLAQKAVYAGEIEQEEAVGHDEPLATVAVCMETENGDHTGFPRQLLQLMDRSYRLYVRVARLDEMVRRRLN